MRTLGYSIRAISIAEVRGLCEQFHGYGSAGNTAVYCFGVVESGQIVAAYAWQPPPPGAAHAVCPEAPHGILALSRMVAVPRDQRVLNHVSKPLRRQMRALIDRTRWPVLITYSDEGQGHTGHVYKCSGWQRTASESRPFFVDARGRRVSSYSNGRHRDCDLRRGGVTTINRWEHWSCERGHALRWMKSFGWEKQPIPGRFWRSGNQAFTYVKRAA